MIARAAHGRARRIAVGILVATVAATGVACRRGATEAPDPTAEDAAHAGGGAGGVTLGVEGAARAGIRTAVVEPAEGSAEIAAFGRVLDPLALVEALHARGAARAATVFARAEYERSERLNREGQNASRRDLESARAALARATADLADATARLTLAWGAAADLGDALADDLVAGRAALVRVDLPAGATVASPPATVAVAAPADPARRQVARVLGPAPTTDPLIQGDGYLALLVDDPPRPGAVLFVTVPRAATALTGVAVPATAVVWVDARPAVYVEPTAGEFDRRPVTLGTRRDDRWIVTAGVGAGERVVVAGAARLVSSEVVGAAPTAD